MNQIRRSGLIDAVNVRKSGYGFRLTFSEFIQTFKNCNPQLVSSHNERIDCIRLLNAIQSQNKTAREKNQLVVGKTKVFVKNPEIILPLLENMRNENEKRLEARRKAQRERNKSMS